MGAHYTDGQRRIIAFEIKRSGGDLAKAAAALEAEYETFTGIKPAAIERMLRKKEFRALLEAAALGNSADKAHAEFLRFGMIVAEESRSVLKDAAPEFIERIYERYLSEGGAR